MKRLTHNCKTFLLDGKPAFLNAGEIQYFRISRDLWRTHLQKAKDAGLNAVSTYIPWDWHEEKEGQFDFEGKTHPQKDLLHWLDLCKEFGLMARSLYIVMFKGNSQPLP
jgi:beta-galactosidase